MNDWSFKLIRRHNTEAWKWDWEGVPGFYVIKMETSDGSRV